MNRALFTSASTTWGTPQPFYEWLDRQLHFTLDVCAVKKNAKHPRFFSPDDDGLAQSWAGETAWCNPPYGPGIKHWVAKARDEAMYRRAIVALLVPARPDTEWWRDNVMGHDGRAGPVLRSAYDDKAGVLWLRRSGLVTGVYFHDERLDFESEDGEARGESAPFPSAVVIHASTQRKRPSCDAERDELVLTAGWL